MAFNEVRSIHFPYVPKKQKDGSYIFLNREYKPLGFKTGDWVDYESFPIQVKVKGITAKVAAKLSFNGSTDLGDIYLYNDDCIPTKSTRNMEEYLKRIAILAKLKVSE